ncbi:hypothetical protein DNTS_016569, partial [Danionella cerebrum]
NVLDVTRKVMMESSGKPSTAQIVFLATSSALTAVFYSIYKRKSSHVSKLREARKMTINPELKTILRVVRSVKETLHSQFVDSCNGVIQRLTLKEKKMVWNRTTHLWNDCEKVIHHRTNSVPFDLAPHDDTVAAIVRVVRPLEAAELDLEMTYENFHPSHQSLTNVIGHFISGERPQGIQETEEMLRLGASMTGVGELVLDNNLVRLQPPKQGLRYFLSRLDYDTLLSKQEGQLRLWRLLSMLFGLTACAMLFYLLWRQYVVRKERRKERDLLDEYRKLQNQRLEELHLTEEEVSPTTCTICLSQERSCVFLECGHVCACDGCYRGLPEPKRCPICRAKIDRIVPLYNS